ncbi:hypothetical protein KPH14_004946 [Odynerus spinipes]|uniref:Uncharacterized protein n=1 Tax=Odynerus spinipes TaxID=1348599 RepID=A0AAD9RNX9_9HYME|nr:hypothetical protein KPH14_004946 [Odynerus spinipes]
MSYFQKEFSTRSGRRVRGRSREERTQPESKKSRNVVSVLRIFYGQRWLAAGRAGLSISRGKLYPGYSLLRLSLFCGRRQPPRPAAPMSE